MHVDGIIKEREAALVPELSSVSQLTTPAMCVRELTLGRHFMFQASNC